MNIKTHVLAVGVEHYQETGIPPAAFAENDARALVDAWQDLGASAGDCTLLLSQQASQATIKSRLKKLLTGVQPGERVVFFYAGHAATFDAASYLTTCDTQPDDLQATSIPLTDLLKPLSAAHGSEILLFLDARRHELTEMGGMADSDTPAMEDELTAFCRQSPGEAAVRRAAFVSCSSHESSFVSGQLGHSIWTSCLLAALRGETKSAVDEGGLLSASGLQTTLADEVPRQLRVTVAGDETQTPLAFGQLTADLVIADLNLLTEGSGDAQPQLSGVVHDSKLRGETSGPVKALSGFTKGFRPPDSHNSYSQSLIRRIGTADVKLQAEMIVGKLRDAFTYKRKDLAYTFDDGAASIKTPDFDVNIWIEQDSIEPANYRLITEVAVLRSPAVAADERFSQIFSPYCDTVVIEFSKPVDIAAKIDEIEEAPEFAGRIQYPADASSFTLLLVNPSIRIFATDKRMTLAIVGHKDLKMLLASAQRAMATVAGTGVGLLPRRKG